MLLQWLPARLKEVSLDDIPVAIVHDVWMHCSYANGKGKHDIKRAINFLVATQKPDGSWPMTSRSTPDGKPGSAKLLTPITCAAASWATLGLARLAPKRHP